MNFEKLPNFPFQLSLRKLPKGQQRFQIEDLQTTAITGAAEDTEKDGKRHDNSTHRQWGKIISPNQTVLYCSLNLVKVGSEKAQF